MKTTIIKTVCWCDDTGTWPRARGSAQVPSVQWSSHLNQSQSISTDCSSSLLPAATSHSHISNIYSLICLSVTNLILSHITPTRLYYCSSTEGGCPAEVVGEFVIIEC